jgi:hypothetical protein
MAAVSVAVSVSAMHLIWLRYLWLLYLSKRYYVAAVSVGAVSVAVYIVSLHTCVSNETLARTFGTSGTGYSVQILKKLKKTSRTLCERMASQGFFLQKTAKVCDCESVMCVCGGGGGCELAGR